MLVLSLWVLFDFCVSKFILYRAIFNFVLVFKKNILISFVSLIRLLCNSTDLIPEPRHPLMSLTQRTSSPLCTTGTDASGVAVPVVSRSPKPVSCTGRRSEPVSSSPVLVVASEPRGVPSSGPARQLTWAKYETISLVSTFAWSLGVHTEIFGRKMLRLRSLRSAT